MPKLKIIRSLIKGREEMEAVIRETIAAQIERENAIAVRDAEVLALNEVHNPGIDTLSESITTNLSKLEQYCDTHPEEFGDARSFVVEGHRIGFRLGQSKPEPAGKLTWKAIIATLKKWLAQEVQTDDPEVVKRTQREKRLAAKYLRQKWEANKEAMLDAHRSGKEDEEGELADIGVEITQGEEFYLEPNRAGQPDVRLSKEAA